jgi:hypothetical protein
MVSNGRHAMGSVTNRPGKDAPLRSPVANPLPFVPSGAQLEGLSISPVEPRLAGDESSNMDREMQTGFGWTVLEDDELITYLMT